MSRRLFSIAERFVESVQRNMTAESLLALDACLDCRQCGSACAWYLETGDEHLHPRYKIDFIREVYRRHVTLAGRLGKRLGLVPPLSEERLRDRMPSFWKCATCGRCTLACPLGLSNRSVVRLARGAFCDAGLTRENPTLREIDDFSRGARHSFGLSANRIHLRLGLLLTREGVEIPFDVPAAEFLYAPSAVVNTRLPDYGVKIPKLLNAAGVRYTYSSRLNDTGTDVEYVTVNRTLSRTILKEVEAEGERLGVRTLLLSECGCDLRTFYVDAGRILGRPFRLAVQSLDSLLLRTVRSGVLPVEKLAGRVTYHDPCTVTRLTGLGRLGRELLACVTEQVREMRPDGAYNYCCNGGAGMLRLAENRELRRRVSRLKAQQIRATQAERVITPCAVCMLSLEDICQSYHLAPPAARMSFMLFEQVYEAAERALRRRGELERFRTPAAFAGASPKFVYRHGLAGRLQEIRCSAAFATDLEWLRQDETVRRRLGGVPDACAAVKDRPPIARGANA
jgi:Fe-S oxidoreductase